MLDKAAMGGAGHAIEEGATARYQSGTAALRRRYHRLLCATARIECGIAKFRRKWKAETQQRRHLRMSFIWRKFVAKNILHMMSSMKHMSPFDVNMALDAGFDSVTSYGSVTLDEVMPLVQDAMFSRSPRDAARTCIFFGGNDAGLALDMMERLNATLLKPFEISSFADPAGSFTTAAAMVACVEKILKERKGRALAGMKILIFGATGVVGYASGVIAALEGANVTLAGHDGPERVQAKANDIKKRFSVDVHAVDTSTPEKLLEVLAGAEIVFCAAKAGVQVLSAPALASAKSLVVAADVNAVPPAGIEGLQLMDNGAELPGGILGIGPLAIGDVKYKTESGLFLRLATSPTHLALDFRDAFVLAREIIA
jgi:methylene-tetrahydromethanopterin dehydrogenase